jgi:hypothetical protein
MNKLELQQNAELVINPINLVTEMGFKLVRIDSESTFWFNRGDDIPDDSDKVKVSYYYFSEIKSHSIGIDYYPKGGYGLEFGSKYKCIYWKLTNGRMGNRMEERFKSELELLVFLKQSKFKIK